LLNNLNGLPLTADQEFQSGLTCNGMRATPTTYIGQAVPGQTYNDCLATQLTSSLVKIPTPGTEQDDHNPQRIQPRSLFDLSIGHDNIFRGDKYKVSLQVTAINIANQYGLQLSFNVQRNALRDAADHYRSNRLPLLADAPPRSVRARTRKTVLPSLSKPSCWERSYEEIEVHYSGRARHAVGSNPGAHRDNVARSVRYRSEPPLKRVVPQW